MKKTYEDHSYITTEATLARTELLIFAKSFVTASYPLLDYVSLSKVRENTLNFWKCRFRIRLQS